MRKKITFLAFFGLFLGLGIYFFLDRFAGDREGPQSLDTDPVAVTTDAGVHWFEAELALTPEQLSKGLMFRREMADNHGMLFYFSFPQNLSFWMKDTYLPLDIIFIREDGTITNIARNTTPHSLDAINSRGWAAGVLEINGGLAEALGIEAGDTVHHLFFGNALEDDND